MDLNWPSPWEEEATRFRADKQVKATVRQPKLDENSGLWTIADDSRADGASNNAQSSFPFDSGKREKRLSETSGCGSLDDRGRDSGGHPSPKLRPLSLPVPPRQASLDSWATANAIEREREGLQDKVLDSKEPATHETYNSKRGENPAGRVEHASKPVCGNNGDLRGLIGDVEIKFDDQEISSKQRKESSDGDLSFLQNHADTTRSRASSSPSDHGDELTGSSRTSFEQAFPNVLSQAKSGSERLAKNVENGSLAGSNESKANDSTTPAENPRADESDFDDFGEFEVEDSAFQASELFSGGHDELETHIAVSDQEAVFNIDPSVLEKLVADIFPLSRAPSAPSPEVGLPTNQDVFTTAEERKTWHRISRYGTMRKHNTGNDEDYRRVKWNSSKIREETIQIVSRWRTQDSISTNGSMAFGTGNGGFWDDKGKMDSGPINMSAIWAERAAKHRSMPLPMASKSISKSQTAQTAIARPEPPIHKTPSEPSQNFGWSTDNGGENGTPPTLPPSSSLKPPFNPPPSSSNRIRSKPAPRPSPMDFCRNPKVASLKALGYRSTMSLEIRLPPPKSVPTLPAVKPVLDPTNREDPFPLEADKNNDDNWGEMISSTLDLDATFEPFGEAPREPAALRNRADSAPGIPESESPPEIKRPMSLQVGALPSLSLTDLAGRDNGLQTLDPPEPSKPQSHNAVSVLQSPPSQLPKTTPSGIPLPAMPKLSEITDDIDAWGSNAWATILPTPLEKDCNAGIPTLVGAVAPEATSTLSNSASKRHTIAADEFDAWGGSFQLLTPAPEASLDSGSGVTIEKCTLPIKSDPSPPATSPAISFTFPVSTAEASELDGWGNANFAIFETLTAMLAPAAQPSPKIDIPQSKAFDGDWGKAIVEPVFTNIEKDSSKNSDEDRIVQSIVRGLPDLSYMFRR